MNEKEKLIGNLYSAAVKAVLPYESIKECCSTLISLYERENFSRLVVAGFGKASCQMAKAIEENLPIPISQGAVITKYGHCPDKPQKMQVHEAGHPLPDEQGLSGTQDIIEVIRNADTNTLIVCLISGGGSALLVAPSIGITLKEKQATTDLLLKAGADIHELNAVRKHLSKAKGGRLAEMAYPAGVISLILSDVIGDRLDVIASGPTAPDTTTFGDALHVLDTYGLTGIAPGNVVKLLHEGAEGSIPETPKEGDAIFDRVDNIIIGNNRKALEAAKKEAECLGFHAEILSCDISGDASEAGKRLALLAKKALATPQMNGTCLISGGETTVKVKGSGKGGRNMELALAFALEIEGQSGITLLSAGTDGTDGPTDAAGAIVDGQTVRKAKEKGLDPGEYLKNNDSYHFFRNIDELFITGPTGTNVMDVQIVLIR